MWTYNSDFEEDELRRLDGSIKKNSAFAKKLVRTYYYNVFDSYNVTNTLTTERTE